MAVRMITKADAEAAAPIINGIIDAFESLLDNPTMELVELATFEKMGLIHEQKALFQYWADNYDTVPDGTLLERPDVPDLGSQIPSSQQPVALEMLLAEIEDLHLAVREFNPERRSNRLPAIKADCVSRLIENMYEYGAWKGLSVQSERRIKLFAT
ncbi:hypothetical protein F66182_9933 [Fusarium sp. NRRL 66182]|nr:hypothetical protein F66182_9933 [Fusarium sp. NRRL 66182]